MRAIFKKEFSSYLHSVVGFLFMAVIIFFFALYAIVYHMLSGYPYVSYTLNAVLFLFLLAIPILSMRILAEERKQKTDQLILTAPVSVGKIVVGKFLAMVAVFLIPVALICVFPPYLLQFGEVSMAESYVAILAFTLYGITCIAVGLFVSSITESQVIAAVLSFAVIFITYMISGIQSIISSTGNLFTEFLGAFDFLQRFTDTTGGVLDITSVVYYLSVTLLLLFLTTQSIQKRRYSVSVRNLSMGAYSSITVVITVALTVIVNLIVCKLPAKYTNFDVTNNKLYTITDQTYEILETVKEDIQIHVVCAEDTADETVAQTLKCYEDASPYIKVNYVDPLINPQFASQYTSSGLTQNSLIVESDKRFRVINYSDLYEAEIDYMTYQQNVTGYDAEGQLTSAIAYCISEDMPTVYIIAGHNEYSLDTGFTIAMEKENVEYDTISLMNVDAIPEDAECIIIHAPETDFSADDADKVIAYLNQGGKAFITTEFVYEDLPNFERILAEFGMNLQKGYAVDNYTSNFYQTPVYMVPNVEIAPETEGLTDEFSYVLAPYAQGINVPEAEEGGAITYTKLLNGSEGSLVKTDIDNSATFEFEEGDIEGPVCLGVKAEKTLDSTSAVMYLFSSAQIFTDSADSVVSGNNKKLFANIMSTVADHEISVSVPVKSYQLEPLTASAADVAFFGVLFCGVLPLGLIAIGVVIWMQRRKR